MQYLAKSHFLKHGNCWYQVAEQLPASRKKRCYPCSTLGVKRKARWLTFHRIYGAYFLCDKCFEVELQRQMRYTRRVLEEMLPLHGGARWKLSG